MSNRIQQVLRDARAMVEDPRPSTPASVGPSSDTRAHASFLNGRRRPTAIRNAHPLPSIPSRLPPTTTGTAGVGGGVIGGGAVLPPPTNKILIPHSPQRTRLSTPPPPPPLQQQKTQSVNVSTTVSAGGSGQSDLEFLSQSAKDAVGSVSVDSAVGARWKSMLITDAGSNVQLCLRAAANIFRHHADDELLDDALRAIFETVVPISETEPPQATCKELRAEGVLDALIIACRSADVLQHRSRLALASDILEVLSEEPVYHDLLVTHGIFLFIVDALKETLRGFLFEKDCTNPAQQQEADLQTTILDLLLFAVRNLSDSGKYAHHVLKTGILDLMAPLLKNGVFTAVRVISKLSYHDDCFAAMTMKPQSDISAPSVLEALVRSLGDDSRVKMDYLTLSRAVLAVARLISGSTTTQTQSFHLIDSFIDELLACVETLLIARGKSPTSKKSVDSSNPSDEDNMDDGEDGDVSHPAADLPNDIRVDMIVAALLLLSGLTSSCVTSSSESGSYVQRVFVETGFVWCTLRNVLHEDWDNATVNELALVCLSNYSYYLPVILGSTSSWATSTTTPAALMTTGGGDGLSPLSPAAIGTKPIPSEAEIELVEDLTLAVCPFLFESDAEAAIEALRTLSNVALLGSGRDWMVENSVDEACSLFLGHEDPRIVFNSLGVLINLTSVDSTFLAGPGREEALAALLKHTGRLTAMPEEAEETKELVLKLLRNLEPSATTTGDDTSTGGCTYGQDAPTPVRRKPASGNTSPESGERRGPNSSNIYDVISN